MALAVELLIERRSHRKCQDAEVPLLEPIILDLPGRTE
jgi:hypothetical protein